MKTDLKPFFNHVLSLKKELPVPLLRELSVLGTGLAANAEPAADKNSGILGKRLERIYLRLCRLQEELSRLDFKKAESGVSAEDFIFSQIDFSRYREMDASYFEALFPEGPEDFDEVFWKKTVGPGREAVIAMVKESYKKNGGFYKIQKENNVILSIMRCLETSLESMDLFTIEEIAGEMKILLDIDDSKKNTKEFISETEKLYCLLVLSLEGAVITHKDGMKTKLFVSGEGKLSGIFRPANKPWTRVLIAQEIKKT